MQQPIMPSDGSPEGDAAVVLAVENCMDSTQTKAAEQDGRRTGKERRADPRFHCWGTVGIRVLPDGATFMGYLLDLGLGGFYVESDKAIPAAPAALVEVLLHLDGFSLRLAGVVRHMEENTRAGIAFTDLSLRKVEQIHKLTAAIIAAENERLAGVEKLGG
jgi:hypothetical protein